jgi:hypothetical protein
MELLAGVAGLRVDSIDALYAGIVENLQTLNAEQLILQANICRERCREGKGRNGDDPWRGRVRVQTKEEKKCGAGGEKDTVTLTARDYMLLFYFECAEALTVVGLNCFARRGRQHKCTVKGSRLWMRRRA